MELTKKQIRIAKKQEKKGDDRKRDDFGLHPNDFEHRCCFKHQIYKIGRGTKAGGGELVEVDMQSGKTAIYKLYSDRVSYAFDDTGQRHWKYLFVRYKNI